MPICVNTLEMGFDMLLGIDLGSSGCKGVLFDEKGTVLCKHRVDYTPQAIGADGCEMDPEVFYNAFRDVVSSVASKHRIRAIGLSSHGETIIPVKSTGLAAGPALMNTDNRSAPQSVQLTMLLGRERIYRITGQPAHPMYSLPKIMWLRENRRDIFSDTAKFCGVSEYIQVRLGMIPMTEFTIASRFLAFDIHRRTWSDEILSAAGLDSNMLYETGQAGQVGGVIPHSAAIELGLEDDVCLTLAGHDQPCGAFGAGLTSEGAVLSAGSYECLAVVDRAPANADIALDYSFNTYCHVCPETYVTLAFFPSGMCVSFFVRLLTGREQNDEFYDEVMSCISTGSAGSAVPTGLLATPHVIGACNPDWNPYAKGTIYGFHPGVSRTELMKAIYEGVACELRLNIEALERVCSWSDAIRVHGGGVSHDASLQLRADITGRSFRRLEGSEAGCHGAALLAGVHQGVYSSYEQAADTVKYRDELCVPDLPTAERYKSQIEKYNAFRSFSSGFDKE